MPALRTLYGGKGKNVKRTPLMLSNVKQKGVVGIRNDEWAHLPHFENIIVRILEKKGSTCASELAREMFPGHTNSEIRPRTSQISVSLKRLQKKGMVKGEKYGRKNFFKVLS